MSKPPEKTPMTYEITFASEYYDRKINVVVEAVDAAEALEYGEKLCRATNGPVRFESTKVLIPRWINSQSAPVMSTHRIMSRAVHEHYGKMLALIESAVPKEEDEDGDDK